jgi:hypothetical protein
MVICRFSNSKLLLLENNHTTSQQQAYKKKLIHTLKEKKEKEGRDPAKSYFQKERKTISYLLSTYDNKTLALELIKTGQ